MVTTCMPATPNIDQYLDAVDVVTRSAVNRTSRPEIFVRDHGLRFTPAALPDDVTSGRAKACYRNAQLLLVHRPDLIYAEGLAHHMIPSFHAWCVTPDGTVIDPTWPDPANSEYLGVPLDTDFVFHTLMERDATGPILMDPMTSHDLLTGETPIDAFYNDIFGGRPRPTP